MSNSLKRIPSTLFPFHTPLPPNPSSTLSHPYLVISPPMYSQAQRNPTGKRKENENHSQGIRLGISEGYPYLLRNNRSSSVVLPRNIPLENPFYTQFTLFAPVRRLGSLKCVLLRVPLLLEVRECRSHGLFSIPVINMPPRRGSFMTNGNITSLRPFCLHSSQVTTPSCHPSLLTPSDAQRSTD